MVTLNILKWLEDNSFGALDLTGSVKTNGLYLEKLTQGKTGIAIFSRGAPMTRGERVTQAFDLYSRGTNDVLGYSLLEDVLDFITDSYNQQCELPIVTGVSLKKYKNIVIVPVSNIENSGLDANDRVIYTATAQITYNVI